MVTARQIDGRARVVVQSSPEAIEQLYTARSRDEATAVVRAMDADDLLPRVALDGQVGDLGACDDVLLASSAPAPGGPPSAPWSGDPASALSTVTVVTVGDDLSDAGAGQRPGRRRDGLRLDRLAVRRRRLVGRGRQPHRRAPLRPGRRGTCDLHGLRPCPGAPAQPVLAVRTRRRAPAGHDPGRTGVAMPVEPGTRRSVTEDDGVTSRHRVTHWPELGPTHGARHRRHPRRDRPPRRHGDRRDSALGAVPGRHRLSRHVPPGRPALCGRPERSRATPRCSAS